MPMPQQLPQIPVLPTRYPDLGKTILHQQLQNMLRILPIGFLLAYPLGANLGGVANPQLEAQLRQHSFKPARMPTGFHSHSHLLALASEVTIKLFCSLAVSIAGSTALSARQRQINSLATHQQNRDTILSQRAPVRFDLNHIPGGEPFATD